MGHMWSTYVTNPDTSPDIYNMPTFDPLYGFPEGRKERVMVATQQEMNDARLPLDKRDFCAHFLIDFYKCRQAEFPNLSACMGKKHDYDQCEYQDYVMRMKEYEREKRLLQRSKRKRLKAAREELYE
ncbi:NADH dehydrogenase [ubiquinone] 1 beta subcomplex subunit 7-like [Amphiura filiformis]|uniref:NADH dehydrogenase [ubiquinone] 1 beta subcomplex subunit 7-like n=1 Tax=Amphiura filiformis TaxID=82378 RepID=UPI003B20BDE8